jgi:hypothetical protein
MLLDEVGVERSFLSRGVRRVAIRQHNIRQETQPCRQENQAPEKKLRSRRTLFR